MAIKRSTRDHIIDALILIFFLFLIIVTLYPFLNSLAISLNDSDDTTLGGITFYPRVFTMANYKQIVTNPKIYNAYFITISRTVIGTMLALLFTGTLAFGMSHPDLKGRKYYTMFCLIPMYFGGGLMATYFLLKNMGFINNFLVYVIPGMVGLWNMILMRSYFQSIPLAMEESARIDGANYFTVLVKIIMPVATPIIATVALYVGVGQWNAWFDANMYITKQELKPMQTILMTIVNETRFALEMAAAGMDIGNMTKTMKTNVRSITMATMIITIVPIITAYPFLQRYFIKGVMVGSLKG